MSAFAGEGFVDAGGELLIELAPEGEEQALLLAGRLIEAVELAIGVVGASVIEDEVLDQGIAIGLRIKFHRIARDGINPIGREYGYRGTVGACIGRVRRCWGRWWRDRKCGSIDQRW